MHNWTDRPTLPSADPWWATLLSSATGRAPKVGAGSLGRLCRVVASGLVAGTAADALARADQVDDVQVDGPQVQQPAPVLLSDGDVAALDAPLAGDAGEAGEPGDDGDGPVVVEDESPWALVDLLR